MIAPIIETIIVLLNCAFKCSLVTETYMTALMQAGTLANQLASTIDCAGNITNFTKKIASESFFFSQDSKVL